MIPKIIHFIWIGTNPLPDVYSLYINKFKHMYNDYNIIVWNDEMIQNENIIPENLKEIYNDTSFHIAFKVDILRYLLIQKYGGLYFDVDFNPVNKLDDSFLNFNFLGAIQNNDEVAIGFFGAIKNDRIINHVIKSIPASVEKAKKENYYVSRCMYKITGPEFFDKIVRQYSHLDSIYLFLPEHFYPYAWWEREEKCNNEYPNAIAIHKWNLSWCS